MPRSRSDAAGVEFLYGTHPVREALRAGRRRVHRLWVRRGARSPAVGEIVEIARERGVPCRETSSEALRARVAGGDNPQGVLLEADPLPEVSLDALARPDASREGSPRCIVALDGVEDPRNAGAIVRVAETAGVSGLVLGRRRSAPLGPVLAHASAGAAEWLPIARVTNLARALEVLQAAGFWIVAGDPHAEVGLFEAPDRVLAGDLVVVLGAEGRGLRPGIRAHVDHPLRVPMLGRVGSLNVATAAAVLLFERVRRAGGGAAA